jgi:hypothetical protein
VEQTLRAQASRSSVSVAQSKRAQRSELGAMLAIAGWVTTLGIETDTSQRFLVTRAWTQHVAVVEQH